MVKCETAAMVKSVSPDFPCTSYSVAQLQPPQVVEHNQVEPIHSKIEIKEECRGALIVSAHSRKMRVV